MCRPARLGVTAYMLNTGRGTEFEAVCERGIVTAWNDGPWRRGLGRIVAFQTQRHLRNLFVSLV